jgi:ElaB/YqjD/DUF883 family membrane-anchored ribosome-binding protein
MTKQSKHSRDIESDIDETRSRMDDTLTAIEHKLSPGELLDEGLNYFRRSGSNDFINNLGATARDNPVPVTLATVGLGWLMMSSSGNGTGHSMQGESYAGSAADKTKHAAHRAGDKANDIAEGARTRLDQMRSGTSSAKDRMSGSTYQAKNRFSYMMNEQPLIMGALGIALGAALGAGMPATETEDELMGQTRDEAVGKAAEVGQQQAEKVKSTAETAKDAAKGEANREGLAASNDDRSKTGNEYIYKTPPGEVQRAGESGAEEAHK